MRTFLSAVLAAVLITIAGCAALGGSDRKIPGEELFTQYGWAISGAVLESSDKLPADFKLGAGFPWPVYVDLSSDIGLDFSAHAGKDVRVLRFPVRDAQGARLTRIAETYALQGVTVLDHDTVIGAWLTYTAKDGHTLMGIPGFSLKGNDLEQATGLAWSAYSAKYSKTKTPEAGAKANLDATTAVVFGAGQTDTITLTDQTIIQSLIREVAAGQVIPKPDVAATLVFAGFKAGDQQAAQLWMLSAHATSDVLAVRFEGEPDWRSVSPALNGLLKPIVTKLPGPKTP
jgi:hypothetical protein